MKIDEDLIYEQLENLRDEIWTCIRKPDITFQHIDDLLSITVKLKGIVAICKGEQEKRYFENELLNEEQVKNFEL